MGKENLVSRPVEGRDADARVGNLRTWADEERKLNEKTLTETETQTQRQRHIHTRVHTHTHTHTQRLRLRLRLRHRHRPDALFTTISIPQHNAAKAERGRDREG